VRDFAQKLIKWQRRHGRHGLPWQGTRDPYRIWVSEIMLQQTRVEAVVPYFVRFLGRFPDVRALAQASGEEVLRLWSGLGYYARARNLHAAAREIVVAHGGRFPRSLEGIRRLRGIGRSTAGAIAVFAFGARAAILDGNAKRVFARCFAVQGEKRQWTLAESLLPARGTGTYTQALMDLGATVCTRAKPACGRCPVAARCVALRENRIEELPTPRRRKKIPLREVKWLVLAHHRCVLLERRPPSGLWGGLWAFPEFGKDGPATIVRALGCRVERITKLPVIEHGFTHFRLRARPSLYEVREPAPRAEQGGRLWVDLADAAEGAVPVPVRKVLRELARRR